MVPPMSTTLCCSSIRSMTGCGVMVSNSRELAPSRPARCRAYSMTMTCRPRHSPRHGMSRLAGVAGGGDLALDPPLAEAAGDDDAVEVAQAVRRPAGPRHLLGLDPVQLDLGAVVVAAVAERLDDRQVGVGQVDVLADQADAHRALGGARPVDDLSPRPTGRRGAASPSRRSIRHTTRSRPSSCRTRGIS